MIDAPHMGFRDMFGGFFGVPKSPEAAASQPTANEQPAAQEVPPAMEVPATPEVAPVEQGPEQPQM